MDVIAERARVRSRGEGATRAFDDEDERGRRSDAGEVADADEGEEQEAARRDPVRKPTARVTTGTEKAKRRRRDGTRRARRRYDWYCDASARAGRVHKPRTRSARDGGAAGSASFASASLARMDSRGGGERGAGAVRLVEFAEFADGEDDVVVRALALDFRGGGPVLDERLHRLLRGLGFSESIRGCGTRRLELERLRQRLHHRAGGVVVILREVRGVLQRRPRVRRDERLRRRRGRDDLRGEEVATGRAGAIA